MPRRLAHEYFDLVNDLTICRDGSDQFANFTDGGGHYLWWRMMRRGVGLAQHPLTLPYTLLRNCNTRVTTKSSSPVAMVPSTVRAAAECYRWRWAPATKTGVPPVTAAAMQPLYDQCMGEWKALTRESPELTCAATTKSIVSGMRYLFKTSRDGTRLGTSSELEIATTKEPRAHMQAPPVRMAAPPVSMHALPAKTKLEIWLHKQITETIGSTASRKRHPPLPPAEARRLNLLMCPHEPTADALRAFGVQPSALPANAAVRVCQHRTTPHAGILYVRDFLEPRELRTLMRDWPTEEELFGEHCNADRGELTSFVLLNRKNASQYPLVRLDERITAFTSLSIGKFAHKRYDNTGNGELLNNLHHDANGACCGMAKHSLAREATLLLYTGTSDLAGGHTIFPTLPPDANVPGLAAGITQGMWSKLRDTYYKAPNREHLPDQFGAYMNSTLGGVTGQACARLADDDAKGSLSGVFGVRPVPGDAVLFFMKTPGIAGKANRHAFHAGCPLLQGSKDAIQKFLQRGGTNELSDLQHSGHSRKVRRSRGAVTQCNK